MIFRHKMLELPDRVNFGAGYKDWEEKKNDPLSYEANCNGDFYYDDQEESISYLGTSSSPYHLPPPHHLPPLLPTVYLLPSYTPPFSTILHSSSPPYLLLSCHFTLLSLPALSSHGILP